MNYLDIDSLILGSTLGLVSWIIIKFIALLIRGENQRFINNRFDTAEDLGSGDFLEIPVEQIVNLYENDNSKDLRSLTRKIQAFKNRNAYYRNRDFYLEDDFNASADSL